MSEHEHRWTCPRCGGVVILLVRALEVFCAACPKAESRQRPVKMKEAA